jgi:condensin complex subunit 3
MVKSALVAAQVGDWTDPRKNVSLTGIDGDMNGKETAKTEDGHSVLAEELLEKILTPGCSSKFRHFPRITSSHTNAILAEDERKTYITLLGKLHISARAPIESLQTIFELVNDCFEGKAVTETAARNMLTRLQNNLSKLLAAAGDNADEGSDGHENVDAEAEAEAEEGADAVVETTELPEKTELEAEEEDIDEDETMMTKFTGVPDAEGTRFMDYDDEEDEDEDEDELTPGNVKIKREPRGTEESLVESLLSDDEDTIS